MAILSAFPVIESLEPRLAPAGVVTFTTAGGTLNITGSAAGEHIIITDNPATGEWTVSFSAVGEAETSFVLNGVTQEGTSFTIAALGSIKATMGDGADQIDLIASASGMVLTGALNLTMGKGDDIVNLGAASTTALIFKGAVSVDLGDGNDHFNLKADAAFVSTVSLKGGAHNDIITFVDGERLDEGSTIHTFQKGLAVDLGTGSDQFLAYSELFRVVGGAVTVKGAGEAGQDQFISFAPAQGWLDGPVSLAVAAGNTLVYLGRGGGDHLHFAAALTIATGTGDDFLLLNGNLTVAGTLTADLKDGDNAVVVGEDGYFKAGSVNLKGGGQEDQLFLEKDSTMVVNGLLAVNFGAGLNSVRARVEEGGQVLTVGSFSQIGTAGNDMFLFEGRGLTILGNATFALGDGLNYVGIEEAAPAYLGGNVSITTGFAADYVGFGGASVTILGNVTLKLGNGRNLASFGGQVDIAGNVSYTGGIDDDIFETYGAYVRIGRALQFTAGDAATENTLDVHAQSTIIGSLKYQGGKGVDNIIFGGAGSNTSVLGATAIHVGAGISEIRIEQAVLYGTLNLTSTGLADQTDKLEILQTVMFGNSIINLGAGPSTVSVDDSLAWDNFTVNLGGGSDVMKLDTLDAYTSGNVWHGIVKISLGAGDDTLNLGGVLDETFNFFGKAVLVDGGAGTDTLTDGDDNTYLVGTQPTKSNFP